MIERLKAAWMVFCHPELIQIRDELTGALTRRTFLRVANRELARAKRGQQQLSLVFIDLDSLKKINDTKGHKAGDIYLKNFTQTVLGNIRPYDILARFGGDEFVLILPEINKTGGESTIRRIYDLFPDFSWGISEWCEGDELETLIARADAFMYGQKEEKKRVVD